MQRNLITLCFLTIAGAAICAAGITVSPAPVPEPGSIVLLGSAAIGIGYAAWRRRNK
jgi:hypothetical protein